MEQAGRGTRGPGRPDSRAITTLRKILNWHPSTPFYYGWLVIGLVALGSFVATSIAGVVLGGIQGLILDDTGWNRASVGLAAGVGVWGTGPSGLICGRLADRFGARKLMPIGTLLLGICLFSIIWAHSLWQFFLIAVIARIVSQPILIGVVPRTVAVNFFRLRRNVALSVISVFRPLSGAINIQLFSVLAAAYGWRSTFQYLGIFSLALTLPMALLIRRQPEDIGLQPDGARTPEPAVEPAEVNANASTSGSPARAPEQAGRSPAQAPPAEESWTAGEAFRTRTYWLVAVSAFLGTTAHTGIGFSLVPYLREAANLSNTQAAGVLSLSTALVLSNIGWGYLAGKFGPRLGIVAVIIISILMMAYLTTVDSLLTAYIFGALWGAGTSATEVPDIHPAGPLLRPRLLRHPCRGHASIRSRRPGIGFDYGRAHLRLHRQLPMAVHTSHRSQRGIAPADSRRNNPKAHRPPRRIHRLTARWQPLRVDGKGASSVSVQNR